MDLSPKAPLSRHEIATLQILKQDHPKRPLSRRHRELLLSMELALAEGKELKLSQALRARLETEQGKQPMRRSAPACTLGVVRSREGEGGGVWDHAALGLECEFSSAPGQRSRTGGWPASRATTTNQERLL